MFAFSDFPEENNRSSPAAMWFCIAKPPECINAFPTRVFAKQQFIAQETIPGMGHECRSPGKVVRNWGRRLAAKQRFSEVLHMGCAVIFFTVLSISQELPLDNEIVPVVM